MKKYLLFWVMAAFSASAVAESETQLKGKELLQAVVINRYPESAADIPCEDYLPAFSKLKVDAHCTGIVKAPPQIAFVGDSHTKHYRPSALIRFKAQAPIVIPQTQCLPFTADEWRGKMLIDSICSVKQNDVLAYLSQTASIKTVVLSSRWSSLMSGYDFARSGDDWLNMRAMSVEDKKTFIVNGQQFIATLLKAGKQVVLMRDVPDLDFSIETCYDIRPVRLGKAEIRDSCSMPQATFEIRRRIQNAVLDEMLRPYPAVKIYDPVPLFCKNGRCQASDGTLPYYLDADHVNNYGAQLVFGDLVRQFFPSLSSTKKESQ